MGNNTTLGDNDVAEQTAQSVELVRWMQRCKDKIRLTLRRFGWRAEGDEARYGASCYHGRRYQPTRESQQRDTQGRQRDRLDAIQISSTDPSATFKSRLTRSASTDTLGVVALLQETVDTTDWELETSLGRAGLGLGGVAGGGLARLGLSANFARHC